MALWVLQYRDKKWPPAALRKHEESKAIALENLLPGEEMDVDRNDCDVVEWDEWPTERGEIEKNDHILSVWNTNGKTEVYHPSRVVHVAPFEKEGRLFYVSHQKKLRECEKLEGVSVRTRESIMAGI